GFARTNSPPAGCQQTDERQRAAENPMQPAHGAGGVGGPCFAHGIQSVVEDCEIGLTIRGRYLNQFLRPRLIRPLYQRWLAQSSVPFPVVLPSLCWPEDRNWDNNEPKNQPQTTPRQAAKIAAQRGIDEKKRGDDLQADCPGQPKTGLPSPPAQHRHSHAAYQEQEQQVHLSPHEGV